MPKQAFQEKKDTLVVQERDEKIKFRQKYFLHSDVKDINDDDI